MMNVFESMESDLDATEKQNEILNDQLLEATLKYEVEKCVLMCSDFVIDNSNDGIKKVKRESIDVQEKLLKRIKILENDFQRCKKQCMEFELQLQHQKEKTKYFKDYFSEDQYAVSIKEDTAYPCLHSRKTTEELRSVRRIQRTQYAVFKIWNQYNILENIKRGPYSKKSSIRLAKYGVSTSIGYGVSSYLSNIAYSLKPINTAYFSIRMTKVIKGEFEKIKDVKVDDVPLTCDTPLEVFNNEVSRLSGMDDDLFTYEVEVANIPCDSKMDDDSEYEADDDMGYDLSDVAFIKW
ncbi:hypothetical protein Tco_1307868, partial [Tanacetum coccineum]